MGLKNHKDISPCPRGRGFEESMCRGFAEARPRMLDNTITTCTTKVIGHAKSISTNLARILIL
jgi:hypothetical protein